MIDQRADLFAFGVVLDELFVGPAVDRVARWCRDPDPDRRPPSIAQVGRALAECNFESETANKGAMT